MLSLSLFTFDLAGREYGDRPPTLRFTSTTSPSRSLPAMGRGDARNAEFLISHSSVTSGLIFRGP